METLINIQVAQDNCVLYDTVETQTVDGITKKIFVRHSLFPGFDTANEPKEIKTLCAETWTQEVIDKFRQSLSQV